MKRIVMVAVVVALMVAPAHAQDAHTMTIAEFRARTEQAQVYMVLGAIALTGKLGIVCAQGVPVGEWRAALVHRTHAPAQPWIDVLIELMDERGCRVQTSKGDA